MNKFLPIYLCGTVIILGGLFVLFSDNSSFQTVKLTTGISLLIAGILSFLASFSAQNKQVQLNYHFLHGIVMMGYGISVLIFCNSFERLSFFTSFVFIFYSVSEIIFCFWLFNLGRKVIFRILLIRLLLGLAVGIATVYTLNFPTLALEIHGLIFILIGVNIMLYIPIMKRKEYREINYTSK